MVVVELPGPSTCEIILLRNEKRKLRKGGGGWRVEEGAEM